MSTPFSDVYSLQDGFPSLVRGKVRFDWVNLGEGGDGDFDAESPGDVNYLRFDGYRQTGAEWVEVADSSYCTLMPASASEAVLRAALKRIMDATAGMIEAQGRAKRACEELSWMSPADFSVCTGSAA